MVSFRQRLEKRELAKWAIAYLAGAFVVFQVMDALAEPLSLSLFVQRVILTLVLAGFFCALVLAWYHGEQGRQRVSGPELLLVTLVLVVAGAGITVLGGADEGAAPGEVSAGSTELARIAVLNDDRPVIAVLPLENLSADEENGYLAAGIHEELLRLLSLVRELGVISRTSVVRYAGTDRGIPEIAAELGARYIVEGSVQEHQGEVRIQVQLIDATRDQHLWADRYDRSLEEVFTLQSDVAKAIAGELKAVISPEEQERIEDLPTQDPIAYDLYLRAAELNYQVREDYDTGVELLRRATRMDPGFALAQAKLASWFWGGVVSHGYPSFDSVAARIDLALETDPNLSDAQTVKGVTLWGTPEHEAGVALLRNAVITDPSNGFAWGYLAWAGYWSGDPVGGALAGRRGAALDRSDPSAPLYVGFCLMALGMYDQAALWFTRAFELDPDDAWALVGLEFSAFTAGDLPRARAWASRLREVGAGNPMTLYFSALLDALEGRFGAAETALERVEELYPSFEFGSLPTAEALLAWVAWQSGGAEGVERLERIHRGRTERWERGTELGTIANDLAVVVSGMGDTEALLGWFVQAARLDKGGLLYTMRVAPWFDPIRDDPEFQSWLEETERRMEGQRRELAAMGPWMPEEVLRGGAS